MAITPLEIQKMRFSQKMRGYDATEVEGFLSLVAEDLAGRLMQIEKLERENHYSSSAWRRPSTASTSSSRPCCGLRRSPRTSPPTPAARPS